MRYVNIQTNTPSAKRNEGVLSALGRLIVMLDDDVVPGPDLLSAHLRAHQGRQRLAISGQVRYPLNLVYKSNYFRYRDSRHLGPSRPSIAPTALPYWMFVAMNCSFDRIAVLSEVGLVDEEFARYGCEDHEWAYRLRQSGFSMEYCAAALAVHWEHAGSIEQFAKKYYVSARYSVPLFLAKVQSAATEIRSVSLLEPPSRSANVFARARWRSLALLFSPPAVRKVINTLKRTDQIRAVYCPVAFRFLAAGAYYRGVVDREGAKAACPKEQCGFL